MTAPAVSGKLEALPGCDAQISCRALTVDVGRTAFSTVKPRSRCQLLAEDDRQNAILLAQERDDIGLLALEPATQGSNQEVEREHGRSLPCCRSTGNT